LYGEPKKLLTYWRRPPGDAWEDLAAVKAPTMVVRGLKSDRWDDPAVLERLTREYPQVSVVTVDSQHDILDLAPDAHVRKFVGIS
jgi:pimeloyl-ACP methyl ester carboxylesterase